MEFDKIEIYIHYKPGISCPETLDSFIDSDTGNTKFLIEIDWDIGDILEKTAKLKNTKLHFKHKTKNINNE